MNNEARKLIRSLTRKGWQYKHRGNGHILLISPEGKTTSISATPSDYRALSNIRSQIKRLRRGCE